ncbi:uncharacterized protein NPIL_284361 [Nephila pilipes]|uniref:Uncharacterized protein n=1 Tax=Nephila pilipes TaxID=299642 RepID=A0A8X6ICC6_NEPPI|nr:uncharacterized protein NPIL_284361 [Nephila pilipes]
MQRRAENQNVADSLHLELFLQQLPSHVQSILTSIYPLTAQKPADKILDISPIQYMLDLGHMRPSNSNYGFPLHLVPKNGSDDWRPVGDSRALNCQTKRVRYPIPSVLDFTSDLHGTLHGTIFMGKGLNLCKMQYSNEIKIQKY